MKAQEWLEAYAAEIGAEAPDEETIGELLELAATAAHSSERIAAPIACFMAGRDGRPPAELRAAADRVAEAPMRALLESSSCGRRRRPAEDLEVRVAQIWRYSVKSLRGEQLEAVDVLADGLRGDRSTQVVDHKGARMTGRTAKRLLGIQSGLPAAASPRSTATRGTPTKRSDLIRDAAGPGASLAPLGRHFDDRAILVATDGALDALGVDHRRLRPNIVIEGVEGLAENEWVGRRLRLGQVELEVVDRCVRCVMTTIDPGHARGRPRRSAEDQR